VRRDKRKEENKSLNKTTTIREERRDVVEIIKPDRKRR
jgi:hypothetical protein